MIGVAGTGSRTPAPHDVAAGAGHLAGRRRAGAAAPRAGARMARGAVDRAPAGPDRNDAASGGGRERELPVPVTGCARRAVAAAPAASDREPAAGFPGDGVPSPSSRLTSRPGAVSRPGAADPVLPPRGVRPPARTEGVVR